MMKLLISAILSLSYAAAALPYEVIELQTKRDAEVAKIDKLYVQALERLKTTYTKKGDLETANEVQALISEMESSGSAVGDGFIHRTVVGASWRLEGGSKVITFREDGKISKSWGQLTPGWELKNGKVHAEGTEFTLSSDAKFLKARGGKKDGKWIKVE